MSSRLNTPFVPPRTLSSPRSLLNVLGQNWLVDLTDDFDSEKWEKLPFVRSSAVVQTRGEGQLVGGGDVSTRDRSTFRYDGLLDCILEELDLEKTG